VKIVMTVILVLLALLSVAAGSAKLTQAPQEVAFFAELGLDPFWLYPLGALQLGGALACVIPKTRRIGLAAIATGFAISGAMIFLTGNTTFGAVSLVPAALALWLLMRKPRATES